ncbi:ATP-dependent DNA helicase sgs1 [Mortierella sp. 14UC]|nr:ATP-dependent DNA helicase sgs1 [Mortierella sp. 14UC]
MRPDIRSKLGVYYSTLNSRFKEATMIKFIKGDIHVLLATEAAGMGCDIADVIQVIQYGFPRDMPSLVQRFGRAARDPKIQGFGILYAPPISRTTPTDNNVREYLKNQAGGCLWTTIDKLFDNDARTCNNSCSGCLKINRPASTTVCHDTRSSNRMRYPRRSEEEKHMALAKLQAWRKETYERWLGNRPFKTGGEEWILPDSVAKQLSQKFSRARTSKEVKAIAPYWTPLEGDIWFKEVAQVLDKFNNDIDAHCGSGSQTTTVSMLDQSEDSSDGDREGDDGQENLPEF